MLRPKQFCNLTEVILRKGDTINDVKKKIKAATLLGTIQASFTDFKFIDEESKRITEEEALLGVSLTGIVSSELEFNLKHMKELAKQYNRHYAKILGINEAKGITCVKPSGTVSQLALCSSGIHPVFANYFIRRVRVSTSDAICKFLIANNVPHKPEVGQTKENCTTMVFEFPLEMTGKTKKDFTAIDQLEHWKRYKTEWCDDRGNPSCTIYVKEHEWLEVGAWVYKNWDIVLGLSFLPDDGGVYQLAPYEEISKETYEQLVSDTTQIDWNKLIEFEREDNTQGAKEFACVGGSCELV